MRGAVGDADRRPELIGLCAPSLPAVGQGPPTAVCVRRCCFAEGRQAGRRVGGGSPKQLTSQADEEIKYSAGSRGGF